MTTARTPPSAGIPARRPGLGVVAAPPRALSVVLAGRVARRAGLSSSLGIALCVLAAQGVTAGPGRFSGRTRDLLNQNLRGNRIARQSVRTKIVSPDHPLRWALPALQKGALRR